MRAMRAPDSASAGQGVAVIAGFGYERQDTTLGVTGLYLGGQLVGAVEESREDPAFERLSRMLASQAGLRWVEYRAHACWARERRIQPPCTLAEYEQRTLEYFRNAVRDRELAYLTVGYVPPHRDAERYLVERAYGLSGGDASAFEGWHREWIEKHSYFSEQPFATSAMHDLADLRRRRKSKSPEYVERERGLESGWLDHLRAVWDATKPVDHLADKAMA